MKKKDGGTITSWEMHKLPYTVEEVEQVYPGENLTPFVISGMVVDDPTGRWLPGYHMKSSLIVKLNRQTGVLETRNTMYKLLGKEVKDSVVEAVKALGGDVRDIFY